MRPMWAGVIAGVAVAVANGLAAWLALRWAWSRPEFIVPVVLGSMAVRLLLAGVVSALLLLFTSLDARYYAGSLILVFVVVQGAEIAAILRRAAADRSADSQT